MDLAPLVIQAVMEFLVLVWTLLQGNIYLANGIFTNSLFQQTKTRFQLFFAYLIYFSSKIKWCPHSISTEVDLTILIDSHCLF